MVTESLLLPICQIYGWGDNLGIRFSLELCGIVWATCDTQAATDASLGVHNENAILLGDGADLASLLTQSTCIAPLGVDGGVIVRLSDGVLNTPIGDSAKYAAATTAAVADITDIAE